jgi:hypothetical protein
MNAQNPTKPYIIGLVGDASDAGNRSITRIIFNINFFSDLRRFLVIFGNFCQKYVIFEPFFAFSQK